MESLPKLAVSDGQYQALIAACDALIPELATPQGSDPGFWSTKASDLEVPDRILEVIAIQNPADQAEFLQLLSLLGKWIPHGVSRRWIQEIPLPTT